MNLLGKICVVLILIMSLVFMTLAMAVYSTHKNWEEDYQAAKNKSDNQQTENRQLIARHDRLHGNRSALLRPALRRRIHGRGRRAGL